MPSPKKRKSPPRSRKSVKTTGPADGSDILDWDVCLDTPPKRPSGKVKVRLNYRGRGKPIPVDAPKDNSRKAS